MDDIFYKPKVDSAINFKNKIRDILEAEHEHFPVVVPYGLQNHQNIQVSKPIRCFLHSFSSGAHNFVVHYGAGVNNRIAVWTQDTIESNPRRVPIGGKVDFKISKLVYLSNHFVYVASCTDLKLRVLGSHLNEHSFLELQYTVLEMTYYEHLDVIITSGPGFIQAYKLGVCLHDPPFLVKSLRLDSVCDEQPWVYKLSVNTSTKEIIAVCHQAVYFISGDSIDNLSCKSVLENRHSHSLTCAALYPARHYVLTGSKDGSIKAWNTAMQRFPLFGTFLGHNKEIRQLEVHSNEPLLFSLANDQTIRIWNIETFLETYRFNAQEDMLSLKLIGPTNMIYSTRERIEICELNLFYSLFASIGARALRLSLVCGRNIPSRIMYLAGDGGVRLISPVHGSVLNMMFPIVNHHPSCVLHDIRSKAMYVLLENGNVMVFSTDTNPCSTIQLWKARNPDERICCLELFESALLANNSELMGDCSLLFGGNASGYICLLKGARFNLQPVKAHQGQVVMLKARKYCEFMNDGSSSGHIISFSNDNIVLIWVVEVQFQEDATQNQLALDNIMKIDLIEKPIDLVLVGGILAMVTRQSLLMHRLEKHERDCSLISYCQSDFIASCSKQDIFGNVSQICTCESLGILATCGKDRQVRLWDTNNNLIRELSFDDDIQGICFGNDRGDLLIGLQSNLYHVAAWKYLTPFFLQKLLEMDIKDDISEKCIAFDPLLKFWYNSFWVRTVPIERTNAARVCRSGKKSIGLTENDYARLRTLLILNSHIQDDAQEKLNLYLRTRNARRRSTVIDGFVDKKPSKSKKSRVGKELPPIKQSCIAFHSKNSRANLAEEKNAEQESCISPKKHTLACKESDQKISSKNYVQLTRTKDCNSDDIDNEQFKAEIVSREQMGASISDVKNTEQIEETDEQNFWPCAPDGYIPNSIIRQMIKPTRVKDYSILINEDEIDDVIGRVRRAFQDIDMLPKLVKSRDSMSLAERQPERKTLESNPFEFTWSSDESDTDPAMEDVFEAASHKDRIEIEIKESKTDEKLDGEDSKNTEKTVGRNNKKLSLKRSSTTGLKETNKAKLKGEENKNKSNKNDRNELKSVVSRGSLENYRDVQNSRKVSLTKINQIHTPAIFRKWMSKSWFPENTNLDSSDVIRQITKKLECSDGLTSREICSLLMDIKNHLGMETPVLNSVLDSLQRLLQSNTAVVRHSAVKTLVELGGSRNDVQMQLKELLTDPVKIVREEAKKGLAKITDNADFETHHEPVKGKIFGEEDVNKCETNIDKTITKLEHSGTNLSEENKTESTIECRSNPLSARRSLLGIKYEDQYMDSIAKNEAFRTGQKPESMHSIISEVADQMSESDSIHQDFEDVIVQKPAKNLAAILAPRLFKKYEEYQKVVKSSTESQEEENEIVFEQFQETTQMKLDKMVKELYSGIENEFDASQGLDCIPDAMRLTKNSLDAGKASSHLEKAKQVLKITTGKHKSKLKDRLFYLLLEVSLIALMLKRRTGVQALNEEIMNNLTLLYTIIKCDDPKILCAANQLIMEVKHELQKNTMLMENMEEPITELQIPSSYRKNLIRSPICRRMVGGIRGERIAKSIEVTESNEKDMREKDHRIFGIPERLGNFAATNNGVSQFGKVRFLWTSKAPYYDMDINMLNEQRVRSLKLHRRPELYRSNTNLQNHTGSFLPTLVKQRMRVNVNSFNKKSKNTRSQDRQHGRRNIIKLPHLDTSTEVRSRGSRSDSSTSLAVDLDRPSSAIEPPPPPNTAEII